MNPSGRKPAELAGCDWPAMLSTAPGPKRARYEAQLQEVLHEYEVIDFGLKEAREWGRYVHSVGRPLPVMDSLIAAVALANAAPCRCATNRLITCLRRW